MEKLKNRQPSGFLQTIKEASQLLVLSPVKLLPQAEEWVTLVLSFPEAKEMPRVKSHASRPTVSRSLIIHPKWEKPWLKFSTLAKPTPYETMIEINPQIDAKVFI